MITCNIIIVLVHCKHNKGFLTYENGLKGFLSIITPENVGLIITIKSIGSQHAEILANAGYYDGHFENPT